MSSIANKMVSKTLGTRRIRQPMSFADMTEDEIARLPRRMRRAYASNRNSPKGGHVMPALYAQTVLDESRLIAHD